MIRRLALVAVAAAAFPASASAHARFVASTPADGTVLATAPKAVRVVFDDLVRVTSGNAAVRNGGGSILAGAPRIEGGETLVLPLRRGIGQGDFSVRWSVLSDDGHREQGVLAFAVGAGRAPPASTLTAASPVEPAGVVSRTLWFLGILLAGGATIFSLATRTPPERRHLFTGFLLAFLGASALGHDVSGTRLGLVTKIGATIALLGGASAALASVERRLLPVACAAALALLPLPTLGGHAIDPGRPKLAAALLDLLHLVAAAAWLGGLASLVTLRRPPPELVRRFSALAFGSVAILGAAGVGRALIELTAVRQLWTSGYGQVILVKSALFLAALGLGWVNRTRLLGAFERLRRNASAELALLFGVVIAVSVLTELRPGRQQARAASGESAPVRAAVPAPGRLTLARRARDVVVALTAGAEPTVTLVGPDGNAYRAAAVRVNGVSATPCGPGCWRAPRVRPGPARVEAEGLPAVSIRVPRRAAPGAALERAASAAVRALRSLSVHETLASGPEPGQVSDQRAEAPDRFSFRIRGGPQGIVIRGRRWDRLSPGGHWRRSEQRPPLSLPAPVWTPASRNAFVIAHTGRVSTLALLDPTLPAWFEVRVDDRTSRPLSLRMTAAAHFMTDLYSGWNTSREIVPPG